MAWAGAPITKQLRLQVPRRKRKRLVGTKPPEQLITRPNQRWGMDFVSDSLADGRTFRALAIVDHYTRQCPVIEVDLSLPGARVLRVLERPADQQRALPEAIRVANGLEFISDAVRRWCERKCVRLDHIQPGRPMQNGHVDDVLSNTGTKPRQGNPLCGLATLGLDPPRTRVNTPYMTAKES